MKYFTKPQIEEIRKQLATLGIRDTDLPNASELTGEEVIAIVQNGINKKVGIRDFFLRYMPENFLDRIVQGESAYDIWKSQPGNNDKTVEEFLESLKGKDGKDGTNGTNGLDGHTGAAAGFGTPIAEVDTTPNGQLGVSIQASGPDTSKIFRFIFHNLAQAVTPDPSDPDDPTPGTPGRSVNSIQLWFKLSTQSANVNPPALSVDDPSTTAGGGWSLQAGTPTEQQQYLWCFMQTNYSSNTDSGYPYSRSDAWISRRYNSDVSAEYSELEADLVRIESELRDAIAGYVGDIQELYRSLNLLSSQISNQILTDLNNVKNRLNEINQSDVDIIVRDGLFKALTSYKNSSDPGKKAFSDLVLDASKALATINTGSEFFNGKTPQQIVSAGITLDGLLGAINMRATKAYVDSILTSDLLLEAGMLQSVIAKAHSCWKKDGLLYQYNIYWDTFWENYVEGEGSSSDDMDSGFYAYEQYMQKSAAEGGPAGDYLADLPAGPFELVVIADEFSTIKQTVDSISSSVYGIGYMWENNTTGALVSYDYFQTQYDARDPEYTAYTYDNYVTNVITGYTKKATSTVLSDFTQTANSIKSTVGQVGYLWYKEASGGGYEYNAYVIPDGTAKASYEAAMVAAGWTLINYAEKVSEINQTNDKIELGICRAGKVWVHNGQSYVPNSSMVFPYDQWFDEYDLACSGSGYVGTYEDYVGAYHDSYTLRDLDYAMTQFKMNEATISSHAVTLSQHTSQIGALDVTSKEIKMGVGVFTAALRNKVSPYDIKSYEYFYDAWVSDGYPFGSSGDKVYSTGYRTYVDLRKGYEVIEMDAKTLAGLKITQDKIWAGVSDGNGNVAAAISILKDAEDDSGKIILDADNVQITGGLAAVQGTIGPLSIDSDKLYGSYSEGPSAAPDQSTIKLSPQEFKVTSQTGPLPAMAKGSLSVGLKENGEGGFVEIDCSKVNATDGGFDAGLLIDAGNKVAHALVVKGNAFIDGTLSGRLPIITNDPTLPNYKASGATLTYKDSGGVVWVCDDFTVAIDSGVFDYPGFYFRVILTHGNEAALYTGESNTLWYVMDYQEAAHSGTQAYLYTIRHAGIYDVVYLGEATYGNSVYHKFLILQYVYL